MLFWSLFQPFLGSFGMLGCLLNFWVVFKLRKGASITHFVGLSVCPKKMFQKFLYNYMHYLMDNPYISHSYMTYLMKGEE